MRAAITRPTTSSMIAALVRIVPILVCCNGMDGDDVMEYIEPGDEGARIGLAVPGDMLVADWSSIVNPIT